MDKPPFAIPLVRVVCSCRDADGRPLVIDALDHPDLIEHAMRVHQQTPEHQAWRAIWPESIPTFDVMVRHAD